MMSEEGAVQTYRCDHGKGKDDHTSTPRLTIDRYIALMSSTNMMERMTALGSLERQLNDDLAVSDVASLLRALLKRLMDSREACRSSSVNILLILVTRLSSDCLPLLIPVIKYRLCTDPDPSEHQRVRLLHLLHELVMKFMNVIPAYLADIMFIFIYCLHDRDPDVLFQTCSSLIAFEPALSSSLASYAIPVINGVMPMLRHRHGRLRRIALSVIAPYMYHRAGETIRTLSAYRESNVVPIASFYGPETRINYFASLVDDGQIKVRSRFYAMLQQWSSSLPEWIDYETLLTPYLLSGLIDCDFAIRKSSVAAVEAAGRKYVDEHEDEFYDQQRLDTEFSAWQRSNPLVLPPLTERASIGARIIVSSQMPRLLPALVQEVTDWRDTTRKSSLALIRIMLIYSEGKASIHALDILSCLLYGSVEQELGNDAIDCARIISHNVSKQVWLPYLISQAGNAPRSRFALIAEACLLATNPEQFSEYHEGLRIIAAELNDNQTHLKESIAKVINDDPL